MALLAVRALLLDLVDNLLQVVRTDQEVRSGRMDPHKQKEEFNYAYVCALGAHAGLNRTSSVTLVLARTFGGLSSRSRVHDRLRSEWSIGVYT
ncbi:hypothetical protein DZC73_18245 [Albitalea terrae]|uniref:Uncharacterized protein n=1 Tax=Piscinibacter terrae TaxID=2496871 RepID=A0A3N7HLR5_9BURK|nr:hypothetical protein DZC73_18245 [Albitalea terrae]